MADLRAQDESLLRLGRALQESGYRFTTGTPATHARVNARPGNQWARSVEDVFGWSRPFRAGVLPAGLHRADCGRAGVLREYGEGWRSTIRASTLDDALFFHSAYPTTESDAVFFGPDTYRFAAAIERHLAAGQPVRRAVDIGCGAGPGAVLVARARPDAEVVAVDINDQALALHPRQRGACGHRQRRRAAVRSARRRRRRFRPHRRQPAVPPRPRRARLPARRRRPRRGALAGDRGAGRKRGSRPAARCCSTPAARSAPASIASARS